MNTVKGKFGDICVFKFEISSIIKIIIAMCVETTPKPYFSSSQPWLILYIDHQRTVGKVLDISFTENQLVKCYE